MDAVEEALVPLIKIDEALGRAIDTLSAEVKKKANERRRIHKLLVQGGLRERGAKSQPKQGTKARYYLSDEKRNQVFAALRTYDGEEFSMRQLLERAELKEGASSAVRGMLDELIATHQVRKTGLKYPEGRTRGSKSLHYAVVNEGD